MYSKIDTAAKELKIDINSDSIQNVENVSSASNKTNFDLNIRFLIRFNRVEEYTLGLSNTFIMPYARIIGDGMYSLGQHRWFGDARIEFGNKKHSKGFLGLSNLEFGMFPFKKPSYTLGAGLYSKIITFGYPFIDTAGSILNSIDA